METQTLTQWNLDLMHSELQFKVKHLVISTVTGAFKNFNVEVATEGEDFATAQIKLSADVDSISTGNEQRDGHLKSDDFFNAEKFPALTFESTSIKKVDDENFVLTGNLTIRDIAKVVDLNVVLGGVAVDPYGNTKAGFEVEGKVNRKEFDLKWDAVTEAGSVVVADTVKIIGNIQVARA